MKLSDQAETPEAKSPQVAQRRGPNLLKYEKA